jgi:hypothetical protein
MAMHGFPVFCSMAARVHSRPCVAVHLKNADLVASGCMVLEPLNAATLNCRSTCGDSCIFLLMQQRCMKFDRHKTRFLTSLLPFHGSPKFESYVPQHRQRSSGLHLYSNTTDTPIGLALVRYLYSNDLDGGRNKKIGGFPSARATV